MDLWITIAVVQYRSAVQYTFHSQVAYDLYEACSDLVEDGLLLALEIVLGDQALVEQFLDLSELPSRLCEAS